MTLAFFSCEVLSFSVFNINDFWFFTQVIMLERTEIVHAVFELALIRFYVKKHASNVFINAMLTIVEEVTGLHCSIMDFLVVGVSPFKVESLVTLVSFELIIFFMHFLNMSFKITILHKS